MTPSPDAVRLELDRVLASGTFAGSKRLSRFLKFVVERALAGDGQRLKEYVIGVEVFDRGDEYDPRVDSIVRVEAGRLRAKLEDYYQRAGASDAVIISIQRGGYTPEFSARHAAAVEPRGSRPRLPWRSLGAAATALALTAVAAWYVQRTAPTEPELPARIAVLPFATYTSAPADLTLAMRLTDGVTAELVGGGPLNVVSSASSRALGSTQRPAREIAKELGADLLLQARVTVDGKRVNVEALLVDGASDGKIWVSSFTGTTPGLDALENQIAAAVARAIPRAR